MQSEKRLASRAPISVLTCHERALSRVGSPRWRLSYAARAFACASTRALRDPSFDSPAPAFEVGSRSSSAWRRRTRQAEADSTRDSALIDIAWKARLPQNRVTPVRCSILWHFPRSNRQRQQHSRALLPFCSANRRSQLNQRLEVPDESCSGSARRGSGSTTADCTEQSTDTVVSTLNQLTHCTPACKTSAEPAPALSRLHPSRQYSCARFPEHDCSHSSRAGRPKKSSRANSDK